MWQRTIRPLNGFCKKILVPGRNSTSGSDSGVVDLSQAGSGRIRRLLVTDPIIVASDSVGPTCDKDTLRMFKELLPDVIRGLTFEGTFRDVPIVNQHVSRCLQYNLMHGKLTRGLGVAVTYKLLAADRSEQAMRHATLLGWCVEMMQASFLIADDVMDQSVSRRGQPCWHRKDGVGLMAVNDSLILESCIYALLKQHFGSQDVYAYAVDAFLETTRRTTIGQSLDMLSQVRPRSSPKGQGGTVDDHTMKLYSNIVKYKTAYYSFYLPVQLGMGLAGIYDVELHRQASNILLETGKFFQIQDDYLDCFGDEAVTGKHGTDIQEGKCSWLIVVAMQRATPKQKELLRECYGSSDEGHVSKVKELYEELKLPRVFRSYEEKAYNDILTLIGQMSGGSSNRRLNPEVFHFFLNRIYKREN